MPHLEAILSDWNVLDAIVPSCVGHGEIRMALYDDVGFHVWVNITVDTDYAGVIEINASALTRRVEPEVEFFRFRRRKDIVESFIVVREIYRLAHGDGDDAGDELQLFLINNRIQLTFAPLAARRYTFDRHDGVRDGQAADGDGTFDKACFFGGGCQ